MNDQDEIRKLLGKKSRYAGAFEAGTKEWKELEVGEEFSRSLNAKFGLELLGLCLASPDPPDLVATLGGRVIALEVTELVCSDAIKVNKKAGGNDLVVYRHWRMGDIRGALEARFAEKNLCQLKGGPFDEFWVCVHTDELELSPERVAEDLGQVALGPFPRIDRAFILFSYTPRMKSYPLMELSLAT